jgi:geranylgeranylglycerol-phosphate geranylgeranyltransferase
MRQRPDIGPISAEGTEHGHIRSQSKHAANHVPRTLARTVTALVTIARPMNVLMAAVATLLGYWLGQADRILAMPLLVIATACATAFGNVVNDMRDVTTDRVSHPERPLPSGTLDMVSAAAYALILATTALASSYTASVSHGVGALTVLVVLLVYALLLKPLPLIGNLTIAMLVAFPLLYGAIGGASFHRLWIPASLAFLLNFSREVVKDIQDAAGDAAAGYRTSAVLPMGLLRTILAAISLLYLGLLFVPMMLGHFGVVYATICGLLVLPVHLWHSVLMLSPRYSGKLRTVSTLLKVEMLSGLAALAVDEAVRGSGLMALGLE